MNRAMVSLLVLAVLVLPPATTATVTMARRNCSNTCGHDDIDIPYPFGLGPSCSLPGFNLTCAIDKHTNTSSLVLGMGNSTMEVQVYAPSVDSSFYLDLVTSISYSVNMIPGVRNYSIHWEAPARPFAIPGSLNMSLFVVGCDVTASLYIGNSAVQVGNCTVVCAEAQIMEKLPTSTCDGMVGIGCCSIGIQVNLRAFTLNVSRISDSPPPNKCKLSSPTIWTRHSGRLTPTLGYYGDALLTWIGLFRTRRTVSMPWRTRTAMPALVTTASVRTRRSVGTSAIASQARATLTSMAAALIHQVISPSIIYFSVLKRRSASPASAQPKHLSSTM